MICKKGIILAGGTGSRLYPLTLSANKQLLPIYDKPVLYYPLTTLMLAGIKEVLIISTWKDLQPIQYLLGSGDHLGMNFSYMVQEEPRGLPEAFILGEEFINQQPVALILGDNFYHGHGLSQELYNASQKVVGGRLFVYRVEDPTRYGVIVLGPNNKPLEVIEKPKVPPSNLAITGLYYFDGSVASRARELRPSQRGELEITDLIKSYMREENIDVTVLGRGYTWFDVGTPQALLDASNYVEVIQSRQGISIASPEEVAWRMKYIDTSKFLSQLDQLPSCSYKDTLLKLVH